VPTETHFDAGFEVGFVHIPEQHVLIAPELEHSSEFEPGSQSGHGLSVYSQTFPEYENSTDFARCSG
jgi:hypothetical protein